MTTIANFLIDEDIDSFVAGLKEWPNCEHGNDQFLLAVSPFTTFYFLYDPERYLETSILMVDVYETFEKILGNPYQIQTHPDSERPHPYGSKRLPDLRESARKKTIQKSFLFKATDEKNHLSSPATAAYFWRASTWDGINNNKYSRIQFYYRWQWWLDNQEVWRRFVLETIDQLQAHQVYSGFAMANPLDLGARSEVAVWERSLAPRFYGLDIDYPFGMADELMRGIRPPTWGFLLSNAWRDKLSLTREDVKVRLRHPDISITELTSGQWIELGDKPDLYPVENGVPALPALLNKLLRPIRNDDLGLVGFGQWDGDPNERFDRNDSRRWLGRFDDDSDWPTSELRRSAPPPGPSISSPAQLEVPPPDRVEAGLPCPRTGWWFTPARIDSRRYVEAGDRLPEVGSSYGTVLWQWDADQGGGAAG